MTNICKAMGLLALIFLVPVSYAGQNHGPRGGVKSDAVVVVDANQVPIAGATVMMGLDVNNPFNGNVVTTDANGVALIPNGWTSPLPVTVQAPGYVSTTIPSVTPGPTTIQLPQQESPAEIEIKGTTQNFGHLIDDGKVHFGLVVPAFTRSQMLAFDMSTVISPQIDTITVLGQTINLPSNITVPDQTVTYVFPIEVNKPDYRTYVRNPGSYLLTATHGNFPLQRVINDFKAGKSIFDMINQFNFIEDGELNLGVQKDISGADIAVNQTAFNQTVPVTAPSFANNQVMLSLALNEQNGLLVPTDLKRFTPLQSMNLKSTGTSASVLSLLMIDSNAPRVEDALAKVTDALLPMQLTDMAPVKPRASKPQDFSHLSFAFMNVNGAVAPQFLPLIDAPALDTKTNTLSMTVPAIPNGLMPVATYAVLSEIQTFGSGSVPSEQRTRLWEVWSPAWLPQIQLPNVAFKRDPNKKYRWDVMYLARPANFTGSSSDVNGVDLQSVTHVTRNALEI